MTPARLAELRALCASVAPGPYIISKNNTTGERTLDALRSNGMGEVVNHYGWSRSNAEVYFDRDARVALPELLDEVERLRKSIRAACDELGVPGPGHPAPVVNAFNILLETLVEP